MAPKPEVIQEWADYVPAPGTPANAGPYTFERGRMEKAIHTVCVEMVEENKKKQAASAGATTAAAKKVKKDDVDFLVRELLLTKQQAQVALQQAEGDLTAALREIMV
ncbi:unnamed protein product [Parajaminaea phylloscopi]